jgi:CheY-like chemotaxis protein
LRLFAVTGWGTDHDRQRSRDAGFDGHLTKPVDLAQLEAALMSVTEREDAPAEVTATGGAS